ncbi:hypothetical protein BAE44_0022562 [Dichanthelium oligosanthes]|uniref:Uncharacterized protein n=1 Tax=Dichanthelium oligosanthes TaxID=888268 RepID=A0A1E5UUC8_9POAL|nr:hypothetical protein BAE44_0022562 [Dichanthelium oligosanthes]
MTNGGSGSCVVTFCVRVFAFLLTVGFIVLIYWAIFQPHHIRATVELATLSNLTVSNNASSAAAVSYHLSLSLGLYNPSLRVNIYYDTINAELRFRDAVIGPAANDTSPSVFYQRSRTDNDVKLEFDYGRPGVGVGSDVAGELEKETKSGGAVRLELHVDVRVRYVFRMFKLRQKPRIWCSLSIPVRMEGRGSRGFGGFLTSADLCRVKLTVSNNASAVAEVSYHLAVSLNLYNPSSANLNASIYYDIIDAELRFRDAVIGPAANDTSPPEFYQGGKTGDEVTLVFDYRRPGVAGELEKEIKSGGAVSLELDVRVRMRYRFRAFNKLRQKPRIWCSMSIPVKAVGRGALAFGDRCSVKY